MLMALAMMFAFAACGEEPAADAEDTVLSAEELKAQVQAIVDALTVPEDVDPAAVQGVEDGVLTVAMECAYPPYNWTQIDDSNDAVAVSNASGSYANGYDVMMSQIVCDLYGWELEVVSSAWDSLVPGVQSGTYDAVIAGQSMTADRMSEVDMAGPYYYADIVVVTTADGEYAGAQSIADLAGGTATAQSGTIWYDSCLPQIPDVDLLAPADTAPSMIMSLTTGQCDYICTDVPTATAAVATTAVTAMRTCLRRHRRLKRRRGSAPSGSAGSAAPRRLSSSRQAGQDARCSSTRAAVSALAARSAYRGSRSRITSQLSFISFRLPLSQDPALGPVVGHPGPALRLSEELSDGPEGQLPEHPQAEHLFIGLRQAVEDPVEGQGVLPVLQRPGKVPAAGQVLPRQLRLPSVPAAVVHPGVLGDGEQPRPDVPPAVEPVHRSQGPGERLLGDLLRQVFVLRECPDIAVDVPEVQPVDGLKVQGPPPFH